MMLAQCRAVTQILRGRDAGWSAQTREHRSAPVSQWTRDYFWPTLLGLALAVAAEAVSPSLLLWMLPVVGGLALAIPLAATTSRAAIGEKLRKLGLLLTPDEASPPTIPFAPMPLPKPTRRLFASRFQPCSQIRACARHTSKCCSRPRSEPSVMSTCHS